MTDPMDPIARAVQREKLDKLANDIATRLELDDDTAERAVQIDYRAGQLCLRADLVERLLAPSDKATALGITTTITRSAGTDGAPVVFVDNDGEAVPDGPKGPRLRILLNDEPVFVGEPYQYDDGDDAPQDTPAVSNLGAPACACSRFCGDVAEGDDHPRAHCKGLPTRKSQEGD